MIDSRTGEVQVVGRDKREHALADIVAAEERARNGDADAIALIESLEIGTGSPVVDMQQILHDCPECRAAMARGEQPVMFGAEEIEALGATLSRQTRLRRKRH